MGNLKMYGSSERKMHAVDFSQRVQLTHQLSHIAKRCASINK